MVGLGWSLSETLGPSNAELDGKQLQEITTAFAKAAVSQVPPFALSNAFCRRTAQQGLVRRDNDSMIWNSGYWRSKRQLGSKGLWMRSLEMRVCALEHYLGHKNIKCTHRVSLDRLEQSTKDALGREWGERLRCSAKAGELPVLEYIARRLSILVNFRIYTRRSADAVDLRAGKPNSFRVLASSCQNSPHAVNRSLR